LGVCGQHLVKIKSRRNQKKGDKTGGVLNRKKGGKRILSMETVPIRSEKANWARVKRWTEEIRQ